MKTCAQAHRRLLPDCRGIELVNKPRQGQPEYHRRRHNAARSAISRWRVDGERRGLWTTSSRAARRSGPHRTGASSSAAAIERRLARRRPPNSPARASSADAAGAPRPTSPASSSHGEVRVALIRGRRRGCGTGPIGSEEVLRLDPNATGPEPSKSATTAPMCARPDPETDSWKTSAAGKAPEVLSVMPDGHRLRLRDARTGRTGFTSRANGAARLLSRRIERCRRLARLLPGAEPTRRAKAAKRARRLGLYQ